MIPQIVGQKGSVLGNKYPQEAIFADDTDNRRPVQR